MKEKNHLYLSLVSLIASLSTLVCCVLPAVFVVLGAGATLAGLLTHIPFLVEFSRYKSTIFFLSALFILIALAWQWFFANKSCPIDKVQAERCKKITTLSKWLLIVSVIVWLVSFYFAFIIGR